MFFRSLLAILATASYRHRFPDFNVDSFWGFSRNTPNPCIRFELCPTYILDPFLNLRNFFIVYRFRTCIRAFSGSTRRCLLSLQRVAGHCLQRLICIFIIPLLLNQELHLLDLDRCDVCQSHDARVASVARKEALAGN